MDILDYRKTCSWNPLKIQYVSVFFEIVDNTLRLFCLFSVNVSIYVYMALVLLEVIKRNKWSVNSTNMSPVVLKLNAMHICQLDVYTLVMFLSLLWSVLSFINSLACCDDSHPQLKWKFSFFFFCL